MSSNAASTRPAAPKLRVPTLYLGGEIFWGADATAMAADFAAAGCRWTEPEYARGLQEAVVNLLARVDTPGRQTL